MIIGVHLSSPREDLMGETKKVIGECDIDTQLYTVDIALVPPIFPTQPGHVHSREILWLQNRLEELRVTIPSLEDAITIVSL